MPKDFKVAVPWFKPANNRTDRVPNYYINTSDKWLILPYEMVGLTQQEIIDNKPGLQAVMDSIAPNL